MRVRIQDVAERAGVSSATVSRVLANKPHVSEELRRRVLQAAEELGYRPSRLAQSLRAQRSRIIGLVISDIQNPFFTALVRAVEDVAYAEKYATFLCNTDEDPDKERLYLDLMVAEQVAGVVVSPARERGSACKRLQEARIPFVTVDRRLLDLEADTVLVDNVHAACTLVDHLIQDGHRTIGAIFPPLETTSGRERHQGFLAALNKHGLQANPHWMRWDQPVEAAGRRLAQEILEQPERPTALFLGNNLLTVGALRYITEQGLRIPDDVALVAFDELDWMSLFRPQLTVVAQPTYEIGRTAAEMLLRRIQEPNRPIRQVVLQPTLKIRQSCAHH